MCSALLAALLLTWTERKRPEAQEALIGVLFVLASTAQILLLANDPHGGEDLKDLLAGQILWVSTDQLLRAAILTAIFLVVWFAGASASVASASTCCSIHGDGVRAARGRSPRLHESDRPGACTIVIRRSDSSSSAMCLLELRAGLCVWPLSTPSSAVIVWVMALIGIVVHAARRNGESTLGANNHR